jgi:GxxExxY protein
MAVKLRSSTFSLMNDDAERALFRSVIGAFYEVYNCLGFGFLESYYVRALEFELRERGHAVGREVGIPMRYKHLDLGHLRLDVVVDSRLVVEAKSTDLVPRHASRQVFNYLRASKLELGLVLHFEPKPEFKKIFVRPHHKNRNDSSIRNHSEHDESVGQ